MRISFPAQPIPASTSLVRDYADRRKQPENGMNRLYAVESTTTTTGMKAEHRLGLARQRNSGVCGGIGAGCGRCRA